ncbi:uncharacterized protein TNCV_2157441 [Trichonephila clavipes]|nr:uncharacterized protein TNCV_2157441 [Trichonephila clavipes]
MSESDSDDESLKSHRPGSAMSTKSDSTNGLPMSDCMKRRTAIRAMDKLDFELTAHMKSLVLSRASGDTASIPQIEKKIKMNEEEKERKRKNEKEDSEGFAFPKKTARPITPTKTLEPLQTQNNFETLTPDPDPVIKMTTENSTPKPRAPNPITLKKVELNMTESDIWPPHSNSIGKKHCGLFKHYKMRECNVLLCPLNTLKDQNSTDRKKETNWELINRFGTRECFVLLTKTPIKFTDQRLLPKFLKKPNMLVDELVVDYSLEFLQQYANMIFLENKGKQSVDFTRLYKIVNSPFGHLDYDSFTKHLYSFYEKFRLKNKEAPENISIVIDVPDSDNIREQQEILKRDTSPHARSELHIKTSKNFLEMRGKRSGNSDYLKTELPRNIAESTHKKVKVILQVEPAVEMLQKVPLIRRMEMNLSFLKIRSEEIAQKISKAPHVKRKIKALHLKVKTKATFLKKRWAAALKIKNKALDPKRKSNSPILKKTQSPLKRKHVAEFSQEQTSQSRFKKIKKEEPDLKTLLVEGKIKALREKVITKAIFQKKRWAAENKALNLKRKSNTPINQPLPENVDDPLSEKKDKELAMKISQKEPALEILNKQHLQENKESGDLLSVKPALETIQQMPRSLRPGKSWAGIFKVEPSQPPLKILTYQQPEINDKEPALEVIGTGEDLSEINFWEGIFLDEDALERFIYQPLSNNDEADNS